MRRVMVDTMVFDALADDPDGGAVVLAAIGRGDLGLCTTQVQEDQLAAIADPVRRKALRRLPRTVVPSARVLPGLDDGRRVPRTRHREDRIVMDAAAEQQIPLVTDDRRLRGEALTHRVEVWSTADLIVHAARGAGTATGRP